MNGWLVAALVLLAGGLLPALWLGATGPAVRRLIGLQLAVVVLVPELILLSMAFGQSSYLIVPVVLVAASFAGTLVYTRLLKAGG
ncbi:monovalent cation/H+ antiporter complex subunit F [Labedaea rhizosphaerae]|uniref:Multiple resistance and pH regulation protein F (MrpF/PhaF) n=1 Tax=Labedaea rhizosphaerae TaxID=598644 RepID=A0A4V3CZS4_LABRH|nr:monovalent cation/H+ antiporter complex subunit F [Labedaea rhizosphaerae]TDQ00881.1 multiple resistance and pH regulation protein F (MrpF/PhaF) [Labedaea rhizosphaerae]